MRPQQRLFHLLSPRQNIVALGILLLSLVAYRWVSTHTDGNLLTVQGLQAAISGAGLWGILVYIGVIALSVVLSPIPGAPLGTWIK